MASKSSLLKNVRNSRVLSVVDDVLKVSVIAKRIRDKRLSRKIRRKEYSLEAKRVGPDKKVCVAMFTGNLSLGGLCDRLWGAVSTYNYCKENGIEFRLHFVSPFRLVDYLEPNKTDWSIRPEDLSYNIEESTPIVIKCLGFGREDDMSSICKCKTKQIHIYTNAHSFRSRFGDGFNELFRPSAILQKRIDSLVSEMGGGYVSVSFRFVRLFGDFDDVNWPVLESEEEREKMIERGIALIIRIHTENHGKKVFVTTDSKTFLDRARDIEDVITVEGDIVHADYVDDCQSGLIHLKTFIDLMLISKAEKAYLGINELSYKSTFARTAAQIGGIPFEEVYF